MRTKIFLSKLILVGVGQTKMHETLHILLDISKISVEGHRLHPNGQGDTLILPHTGPHTTPHDSTLLRIKVLSISVRTHLLELGTRL